MSPGITEVPRLNYIKEYKLVIKTFTAFKLSGRYYRHPQEIHPLRE